MAIQPDWIISAEELKTLLPQAGKTFTLVDVREPDEHAEGALPGSILIPLDEISTRATKELQKDADIIIYCAHGVRSMHALMALKMQGFSKLRSLEGGFEYFRELNG